MQGVEPLKVEIAELEKEVREKKKVKAKVLVEKLT